MIYIYVSKHCCATMQFKQQWLPWDLTNITILCPLLILGLPKKTATIRTSNNSMVAWVWIKFPTTINHDNTSTHDKTNTHPKTRPQNRRFEKTARAEGPGCENCDKTSTNPKTMLRIICLKNKARAEGPDRGNHDKTSTHDKNTNQYKQLFATQSTIKFSSFWPLPTQPAGYPSGLVGWFFCYRLCLPCFAYLGRCLPCSTLPRCCVSEHFFSQSVFSCV